MLICEISGKIINFPQIALITADLIITVMLPEAFKKRIQFQPYIDAERLFEALEKQSPVSVRINTDKWPHSPVATQPVPWCNSGYHLDERPSYTPDPLFHAGCYYPQEASGMFLEQVFLQIEGNNKNMKVLDLCGAPGGKSTHLSSLISTRGFLVSNEVIRQRASILAGNLTKWGLPNFIVTQSDPSAFARLPGFFDIILVDAPCSGEGMFSDPAVRNEWSVENAAHCSVRQRRILSDVWPALKEDGILVYSTCTFNPEENEMNIKWLTDRQEAEPVRIDISRFEGIREIDFEGIYGYGFYPGKVRGEGLFISVLRKKSGRGGSRIKTAKGSGDTAGRAEMEKVQEWTSYSGERIVRYGAQLIGIPCEPEVLSSLTAAVKVVTPGTSILEVKKNSFIPSHDLALSAMVKKDAFPSTELDTENALAYLRRNSFRGDIRERGWNLVRYKGVNLGFVNNIGTRLNNYYPVEWRIRMGTDKTHDTKILNWNNC